MEGNELYVSSPFLSSLSMRSESDNLLSEMNFYGLRKQNYIKNFRKLIIQLSEYIYSVSPSFILVHSIMTIIRIVQFCLPCLIPGYFNFWRKGSVDQITINVVSVFCFIIPPAAYLSSSYIFFIIYIVADLTVDFIILTSAFYFKKNAKLPTFIPPFIYFYQSTFGHFFHPIVTYLLFEGVSYIINPATRQEVNLTRFIVLGILSVFCICFNFFLMSILTGQSLIFRPLSFSCYLSQPQYLIFFNTIIINLLFGLGTHLALKYQIAVLSLNFCLYALTSFSVFLKGGFIQTFVNNAVLSASATGAVFTLLDIVFIATKREGSLAIFFAFFLFFIIMIIVDGLIIQYFTAKQLKLLDSIQADPTAFSYIRTTNQYIQLATIGIKFAHPIILDLNFFNLGSDKFNHNQYIYLIYSKFIAIYPEETVNLKYVYKSIKLQDLKGSAISCIKSQTRSIMRERESGLSAELKGKINSIKKLTQSTKHKLGHVWDVVIRGNLSEIELATKRAISAINQTNTDYKHLLRAFPNNRNVTNIYSLFLNDIMADHEQSVVMHERTKLLLPRSLPLDDQAHEFGLKTFPNLPSTIKFKQEQQMMTTMESTMPNQEMNDSEIMNGTLANYDKITAIRYSIKELKIPSIIGSKLIRIITSLVFFVIPCILGFIMVDVYINKLKVPLNFIGALSRLRSLGYQVIGFSLRYVGESLDIFPKNYNLTRNPPTNFGSTWVTKEQLEYILVVIGEAIQDFGSFRMFGKNNKYINQAQNLIFQNTVPYRYYYSPDNYSDSLISIQSAYIDFTIQQKMLLAAYSINRSILSSGTILNPINNAYSISMNARDALDLMIEYINSNYENIRKMSLCIILTIGVIILIAYITTLVIQLKWLNRNKQEVYLALFSLPKNVVSELAENKIVKKIDKQIEEMNKQDENILKIFNSGGASDNSLSDVFLLILGTVFIIILAIVSAVLFTLLVFDLTKCTNNSSPHLHYLQSTYTNLISSVIYLNSILFRFAGYPIETINMSYALERMFFNFERMSYYYHFLNSGGPSSKEVPFKKFIDGTKNATIDNCSASQYDNDQLYVNDRFVESFECSPVDMLMILIEPIIRYCLFPYESGKISKLDSKYPIFQSIWNQLMDPIYDKFFEPLHNQIIPTIDSEMRQIKNKYIVYIIVFLILVILIEVILFVRIIFIENHIKSVLLLLLHCRPSVIYSCPKIMRILAGDFSGQNDSLERNSSFFDNVVTSLPNAIMYSGPDMIIQSANEACQRTFGDIELVGKSIKDFFLSTKFSGNVENLFSSVNSNITEEIAYKTGSTELILKATSMMACGKFVITCQNVTQSHNYNTLILEEKQNSDKLLSTILPPSLVSRVQEGETNISFSVQSASILFSDIVSFTPWCSSLPSEKVMRILNILFKKFDSILDTKRTMTKIKCIGDCYMAAGGIFAEINQPTLHAKEVVSFGIQSIKAVCVINEEIHENLKIRVGVNTGGPIVAGVLGIGKPTFEILGPAINRAQQMEQNGTQMKVHISSAVYELICGLNFKFSNRKNVECKNEVVTTYLVEP